MKKMIIWNFLITRKKFIKNHQLKNNQKYLILILINVEKIFCIILTMIIHHIQLWIKLHHMMKTSR
jgi:hypothetical protein